MLLEPGVEVYAPPLDFGLSLVCPVMVSDPLELILEGILLGPQPEPEGFLIFLLLSKVLL